MQLVWPLGKKTSQWRGEQGKQEPRKMCWNLHLSLQASNLNDLDDLQEKPIMSCHRAVHRAGLRLRKPEGGNLVGATGAAGSGTTHTKWADRSVPTSQVTAVPDTLNQLSKPKSYYYFICAFRLLCRFPLWLILTWNPRGKGILGKLASV